MTRRDAAPGRVLRLSLVGWGFGQLAMGRTDIGLIWLAAEVTALALVAGSFVWLAEGTYYLVPFLLGSGFVVAWAWQAVDAYRSAQLAQQAIAPAPPHSPAGAVVWLAVPLLVWGTGFWLSAAGASGPGPILDRFVTAWQQDEAAATGWPEGLAIDPGTLARDAGLATERLEELCGQQGVLCDPENLLRDVRIELVSRSPQGATAIAEMVRFERLPSRLLGLFDGSELVPVPIERVLTLELGTLPEPGPFGIEIGARRWIIVASEAASQTSVLP